MQFGSNARRAQRHTSVIRTASARAKILQKKTSKKIKSLVFVLVLDSLRLEGLSMLLLTFGLRFHGTAIFNDGKARDGVMKQRLVFAS